MQVVIDLPQCSNEEDVMIWIHQNNFTLFKDSENGSVHSICENLTKKIDKYLSLEKLRDTIDYTLFCYELDNNISILDSGIHKGEVEFGDEELYNEFLEYKKGKSCLK